MQNDLPKESRVARLTQAGGPFQLDSVRLPELQAGEALLRVEACTVCASDLRTFRGERAAPSSGLLGHEIVGRIVAAEGDDWSLGERVICGVAASCGKCCYCERGIPQKCISLQKFGHASADDRWQLSGGFAEYCHLPVGAVVTPVAEAIPSRQAAWLGCAGATAAAAIRTAGRLEGCTVLVLGSGAVGLFVATMAAKAGAEVLTVDCREDRLELAGELGVTARHGLSLDQSAETRLAGLKEFVNDHSGRRGAEVVFETTGVTESVAATIPLADTGGRIVLVGSVAPSAPVSLSPEKLVTSLLRLEGVHNYTPPDLIRAVEFVTSNPTLLPRLAGQFPSIALTEINAAFESALSGEHLRVAVEPTF
jgi:putative phosphonate catabolism associated alcohol dehydrogenase